MKYLLATIVFALLTPAALGWAFLHARTLPAPASVPTSSCQLLVAGPTRLYDCGGRAWTWTEGAFVADVGAYRRAQVGVHAG